MAAPAPPTWRPTKETTVVVPTATGVHVVHVAASDGERDVLHTMRCLKGHAERLGREQRQREHAALVEARAAEPPPPPPPDPLLDVDAQRTLLTELMHDRQRMRAEQEAFDEHLEHVHELKRQAEAAVEAELEERRRQLGAITDEDVVRLRDGVRQEEGAMLAVARERRRVAMEKLEARRARNKLDMGLADQQVLLSRGQMVPAHLTLAASASYKEPEPGAVEALEAQIQAGEERAAEAVAARQARQARVQQQKEERATAALYKGVAGEGDEAAVEAKIAAATSGLVAAEVRHAGRAAHLKGHSGAGRKKAAKAKKKSQTTEEQALDRAVEEAAASLAVARKRQARRAPVSPPSEPAQDAWCALLKAKQRSVTVRADPKPTFTLSVSPLRDCLQDRLQTDAGSRVAGSGRDDIARSAAERRPSCDTRP